jgi:hypothetical protein
MIPLSEEALTLRDAEYIQCEFMPMPDGATVVTGKVIFTINGTFRLNFDIPPQTALGKRVFVRDLSPEMNKWTAESTP